MTGVPQFNIPLFDRIAFEMRAGGYDVVSPAELDSKPMREAALLSQTGSMADIAHVPHATWGDCLARDVKLIADDLDAIVLLPGWWRSRGARLEAFVGLLCQKRFYTWELPIGHPVELDAFYVRSHIMANMP
jgi:hypothetical protein